MFLQFMAMPINLRIVVTLQINLKREVVVLDVGWPHRIREWMTLDRYLGGLRGAPSTCLTSFVGVFV